MSEGRNINRKEYFQSGGSAGRSLQTVAFQEGESPEGLVYGRVMENRGGKFYCGLKSFGPDEKYGNFRIGDLENCITSFFPFFDSNYELENTDLNRIVYLDIESASLPDDGYGAFMIGLGYFDRGTFKTEVLFMRDYNEEYAMYLYLAEILKNFDAVITYNGILFDIPKIEERMRKLRMPSPFVNMEHFDSLYPARKIWRSRHHKCGLKNLEVSLLDLKRTGDIHGRYISPGYTNYVRTKDTSVVNRIFHHNILDVVSLATVTCLISLVPRQGNKDPYDQLCVAGIYREKNQLDKAEELYCRALEAELDENSRFTALAELSSVYSSRHEYEKARDLWDILIKEDAPMIYPYMEYSKYCHRMFDDLPKAREWAERALEVASGNKRKEVLRRIRLLKTLY